MIKFMLNHIIREDSFVFFLYLHYDANLFNLAYDLKIEKDIGTSMIHIVFTHCIPFAIHNAKMCVNKSNIYF